MAKFRLETLAYLGLKQYVDSNFMYHYFQMDSTCGHIQYAFTKDCPTFVKNDILECIASIEGILKYQYFYEAPMHCVSRDKKYWDK